jgi:hypothetical protein
MKNKIVIFILLLTIMTGCGGKNKNPCGLDDKTLLDLHTLDSVIQVPEIRDKEKKMLENEYGESSLIDAKFETYRFILHSAWSYWRVVRIEKKETIYSATIKQFGQDTSYSDTTRHDQEFEISKEQWQYIVDELSAKNFWTYPTTDERNGLDGATWILEGYKPKKDPCTLKNFHHAGRWSPEDTTYINMCMLLYELKPETTKKK